MNIDNLLTVLDTQNGEENSKTMVIIIIGILIFFRVIAIIWTAKDISARTNSSFFHIISVLFVTLLTPIIGLPLYIAIRPIGYKRDKTPWRDSCLANNCICQNCGTLNPKEYKNCIKCGEKLVIKCKECNNEYPNQYGYCPICGAPNIS